MAKKAIVWGRVSTVYQELDKQVAEMMDMAVKDGYKDNIITIKAKGASARKQDEQYKAEISELMTHLTTDNSIEAVYVWEVSRIARCELPFYTLKDYLVRNKVNLIVKTPSIRLLNDKKEIDSASEIVLNLLMTIAKQEMEITGKRMKRGKVTNKEKGKFGGGRILFGYATDKDKNIIIDEQNAEIVREIFTLYNRQNKTGLEVWQIINGKYGVLDCKMLTARTTRIYSILKNYNYAGITTKTSNLYPAIVSKSDIDEAVQRMKRQAKSEKHNTKHIFYGKGLLRTVEGYPMHPHFHNASYSCTEYDGNKYIVNANAVDTIIWGCTCYNYDHYIAHQTAETKEDNKRLIEENEVKINSLKGELADLESRKERLNDLYLMGNMSKEKYSQRWNALEADKVKIEDNINSLLIANSDMKAFIDDNKRYVYGFQERLTESVIDEQTRKTIIDKTIESVEVEKVAKCHYILRVKNKLGYERHYPSYYEIITRGNTTKAYYHPVGDDKTIEVEITRKYSQKTSGKACDAR